MKNIKRSISGNIKGIKEFKIVKYLKYYTKHI